jgi:DNA repair protein RadC
VKPPAEFKVMRLRDCGPSEPVIGDQPSRIVAYWRQHIPSSSWFSPDQECMVSILLNTRCRITGHVLVGLGTLDTVICHAREVFRAAIINAAHSVVMVHNHPSGDHTPSEADIRISRELQRGGHILKIELKDSIIIGGDKHTSLRELGHFPRL